MKFVLFLGFRNLFRQKRRSILLGSAVGFGMMILVITTSFSHGISDNIFNRMLVYSNGHIELSMMEKSKINRSYIRDKERFMKIISDNIPDIRWMSETVGIMSRIVGNRTSKMSVLVGLDFHDEGLSNYFQDSIIEGGMNNMIDDSYENPVIFTEGMVKKLDVKFGDAVKVRFTTVTGQVQSARLTVAGIMRGSSFMNIVAYVNRDALKDLMGIKPYETGGIQIVFKRINDPTLAIREADKLHKLLEPEIAVIYGNASNNRFNSGATAFGFYNNEKELSLLKENIKILNGMLPGEKSGREAMISNGLADKLKIRPGDLFTYSYKQKFEPNYSAKYTVSGVFESSAFQSGKNIILLNENEFYKTYLEHLPDKNADAYIPGKDNVIYPALSPEWKLLPRTSTAELMQEKLFDLQKTRWQGPSLDVRTMYETGSQVLQLEKALNIIAFIAVLILFFIILIGVLNTLRMTIRERTREIGTVRAIGMQRKDVRNLFVIETILLSFFASIVGIIAGIILMNLGSLVTIKTESIFSMLLVENHLYFVLNPGSIVGYVIFILILSAVTALLPARHAAKLSAASALRHYE